MDGADEIEDELRRQIEEEEEVAEGNANEIVIMVRRRIMSEAQWVDWSHMAEHQDPIFNQVIAAYESHHIKRIMRFYYD
jgi:hypothetical protein